MNKQQIKRTAREPEHQPLNHPATRKTICLEEAAIISQQSFPGDQYIVRVRAPGCAARAQPGSFAHLTCDPAIPMRRPLSIMRADRKEGWLEFLYKPVGVGLAHLAKRTPGDILSVLGPIGNGFTPQPDRPSILAIGGGVGIPPMVFLAESMRNDDRFDLLVMMGSEVPFPFTLSVADIAVPGVPPSASHSVDLLQGWGIGSRVASKAGYDGCFDGFVPDLARVWLAALPSQKLQNVQLLGCGPLAMLKATAALARDFDLPCQVAVEEYMACGVGGCAGCTVLLHTPAGPAMKRVCVDGPVFDAYQVYPD